MHIRRYLLVAAVVAASLTAIPGAAAVRTPQLDNDDWEAPIVVSDSAEAIGIQGVLDDDPNGLVPKTPFVQRYSLDTDHWEVWRCGSVSTSLGDLVDELEAATVDYFDAISGGRYTPSFSPGGSIAGSYCLNGFLSGANPTVGTPEGILIVDDVTGGGYASPGSTCTGSGTDCPTIGSTFPSNGRYLVIGEDVLLDYASVAAHELGHTLQWPHSYSGISTSDYDNPIDVMSGNSQVLGNRVTEPDPYSTLAFNRYQSGWVDPSDVVVADGTDQSLTLQPFDVAGTQLLAVPTTTAGQFYVFGTRRSALFDPIPAAWEGVEVYFVDHDCDEPAFGGICPGIWREHLQEPPGPQQIPHVLTPGESIALQGLPIEVVASVGTGYSISIDSPQAATVPAAPAKPSVTSVDDEAATLAWAEASNGGSAILNYDLEVENRTSGGSDVSDVGLQLSETIDNLVNGDTYRARARATNAIGTGAWSSWSSDFVPSTVPAMPGAPTATAYDAAVGVTWSAPASNGGSGLVRYEVQLDNETSGSSAVTDAGLALLATVTGLDNGDTYRARVRAVNAVGAGGWSAWSDSVVPSGTAPPPPPPPPGVDTFVDDDDSIFEEDIEWLAASGITQGCNPPLNNRFCPTASVTRGQMAAFLVRALDLTASGAVDFVDDDNSVFEADVEKLAASGITTGCNAAGTRFCPDQQVTRGQMAAFLVRALDLSDGGAVDFVDDDTSIFEDDIEKLATAGITAGCNAAGTEFCPDDPVTRGQMAAFLRRALGGVG